MIGVIFSDGRPVFAQPSGEVDNEEAVRLEEVVVRADTFDENGETIADPLKSYNRAIYNFNDKVYFYLLKPTARGYKAILPEKARLSVRNALSNITMPVRFVNCLLQGKLKYSAIELTRFAINTTWGIVGLFDPAKSFLDLKKQEEDFGQTLGFYGVKEGFSITWPLLGPSNVRDTIGFVVDAFSDPFVYTEAVVHTATATLDKINETSLTLGEYEELKKSAIDPYISLRNAHFQYRRNLIKE